MDDITTALAAAVAGDHIAVSRITAAIDARSDRGELTPLLDPIAGAAAQGSDEALDLLLYAVQRHQLAVPAIRQVIVNPTDVEDVGQDVMMSLSRSITSFDSRSRFTTWLFRVSRNTAIDFLRKQRSAEALGDTDPVAESARLSSIIASRESVLPAVAALPETFREPVRLRDIEGHSYDAIAERLDINLNTVKSRIARGRAMLAGAIGSIDG